MAEDNGDDELITQYNRAKGGQGITTVHALTKIKEKAVFPVNGKFVDVQSGNTLN